MLFRWRCWMRAVWYAITNPPALRGPFAGAFDSGHDFAQTDEWDIPARVDVLRCADCNATSVGWRRV